LAFSSLILSALLSAVNPVFEPPNMVCRFAPEGAAATLISVRPGAETNRPGLFRVNMWVAGQPLVGSAVALHKTKARDVVVRGISRDKTTWLIALRDNGTAYLQTKANTAEAQPTGVRGTCTDFEDAMETWLKE